MQYSAAKTYGLALGESGVCQSSIPRTKVQGRNMGFKISRCGQTNKAVGSQKDKPPPRKHHLPLFFYHLDEDSTNKEDFTDGEDSRIYKLNNSHSSEIRAIATGNRRGY